MDLMRAICEHPIPGRCSSKYKGMAFDGCFFYFTCPRFCEIAKYDDEFHVVEHIKVLRPYTCICYDPCQNCFWAAAQFCRTLFKLDTCLNEIDAITFQLNDDCGGAITGISYNCGEKNLLVSFANCVVSIDATNQTQHKVLQKSCAVWNMGVLAVSPSYMIIEQHDSKQTIAVYDVDDKIKCRISIDKDYIAEALLFNPCTTHGDKSLHFYLLVTKKGCYSYLLEFELDCCELEVCHCNFLLCRKHCYDKPPCQDSVCACNDILESIALVETALSQVLNAESEKLQKIIASTNDVEKILCANKSINQTVVSVTQLEIVLYNKLMEVKEMCCHCSEDEKCGGKKPEIGT